MIESGARCLEEGQCGSMPEEREGEDEGQGKQAMRGSAEELAR